MAELREGGGKRRLAFAFHIYPVTTVSTKTTGQEARGNGGERRMRGGRRERRSWPEVRKFNFGSSAVGRPCRSERAEIWITGRRGTANRF